MRRGPETKKERATTIEELLLLLLMYSFCNEYLLPRSPELLITLDCECRLYQESFPHLSSCSHCACCQRTLRLPLYKHQLTDVITRESMLLGGTSPAICHLTILRMIPFTSALGSNADLLNNEPQYYSTLPDLNIGLGRFTTWGYQYLLASSHSLMIDVSRWRYVTRPRTLSLTCSNVRLKLAVSLSLKKLSISSKYLASVNRPNVRRTNRSRMTGFAIFSVALPQLSWRYFHNSGRAAELAARTDPSACMSPDGTESEVVLNRKGRILLLINSVSRMFPIAESAKSLPSGDVVVSHSFFSASKAVVGSAFTPAR